MITWTSSLEIGVRAIDTEHKHLIEFINLVKLASDRQRSIMRGDPKLLNDLKSLLQTHFEREEDLMFGVDYPGVNTHMTAHSTLQSDLDAKIMESEQSGDVDCAIGFVSTWIIDHMKTEDTKLAKFIQKKKEAKAQATAARAAPKSAADMAKAIAQKSKR